MSGLLPVAVYGLKVPAGDVMIPSLDFPATFRLTMAAIDPTAEPEHTGTANGETPPRATLKLIYDRSSQIDDEDDSEGSSDEQDYLKALMEGQDSDGEDEDEDEDESSSDDEDVNGGPSDPARSRKARKQAAAEQLMKALAETVSDDEMEIDGLNGQSGKKRNKGKGKALSEEDGEDSEDDQIEDGADMEEVIVCTLDPQKNYQQPLDLTIGENERAFFKVSGTHAIHLTGNYVIPAEGSHDHDHDDGEEDEYDLSPGEEDLDDEDESDELDHLEDPRITEVDTEEDEAPKLTKKDAVPQKGKNKRVAEELEEEPANLDEIVAKSLKPEPAINGEQKLSKKQLKKLKNNAGKAVEAAAEVQNVKAEDSSKDASTSKTDKKVQFAKNLEQGPTNISKSPKAEAKTGAKESKAEKKDEPKVEGMVNGGLPKASLGPKTLQGGVKIDDKKLGKGPACKKGNKIGMRYIGKLQDGKIFDANKSGSPFTFTLGTGEVIKGWDIGVAGMSVGGERRIDIPASLAYGSRSVPKIPANSDLRFDVKLLKIS
ncbi:MAG: hypothetical protein L6R42_003988 [Xanthoria sp. 1 TBL-2021]|nr:MAG: hypothetical protein L6R42_003988 [Xanthoria sp. 1 TBL-2021]